MSSLTLTLIGGPTALIEIDGFRLLTDPTFDLPGTPLRLVLREKDNPFKGRAKRKH